ncbi:MAG: DoxX family protein [Mycobacterium sp.]
MKTPTTPQTYTALAAVQAVDAALCVGPVRFVGQCLEDVELPRRYWTVLPVVKAASAVGLASVWRTPALARFTAGMLTLYFTLAVGAHIRVRDFGRNFASATALLAVYGVLAGKSPRVNR